MTAHALPCEARDVDGALCGQPAWFVANGEFVCCRHAPAEPPEDGYDFLPVVAQCMVDKDSKSLRPDIIALVRAEVQRRSGS